MSTKVILEAKFELVKSDIYWTNRIPSNREDIEDLMIRKHVRFNCLIQGKERINCAVFPDGHGNFYIMINKTIRKKLELEPGDNVLLELERDDSQFGMPVPDVFSELMEQDPEGTEFFMALTPGKQRSLIYIINKPKSEEIKLRKALDVFRYLKESHGKLDYKELNEAFKNSPYK